VPAAAPATTCSLVVAYGPLIQFDLDARILCLNSSIKARERAFWQLRLPPLGEFQGDGLAAAVAACRRRGRIDRRTASDQAGEDCQYQQQADYFFVHGFELLKV
jgi:hypothetical protein